MTTFNTGNPIGSKDPRDLYDNSENLDVFINDKTKTHEKDRLGVERRTWHGIEQKAEIDIAAAVEEATADAEQYRDQALDAKNAAQTAAMVSGFSKFADTLAELESGIGTEYVDGDVVMVFQDESRNDSSSIYMVESGEAVFKSAFDKTREDLLSFTGNISADAEWSDVPAHSDPAFDVQAQALANRTEFLNEKTAISVTEFGARTTNTSAQNLAAFQAAEAAAGGSPIYVPDGEYRLTTPMDLGYAKAYFGPGVLKFDNAEWWRKGGSSGAIEVQERYTLFYEYDSQSDVTITFDDVPQSFTWLDNFTILAPGSSSATAVKINIANGRLRLGSGPEMVRSYNTFANGGHKVAPSLPSPTTTPVLGMNNASYGSRSLQNITTGGNNTAFGSRVLTSVETGENNTGMGFQALYRVKGSGNTAIGSIAGEWITTGENNTGVGVGAIGGVTTGSGNTSIGVESLNEAQEISNNTALGFRAVGNPGPRATFENCVYVGAFAGDFNQGSSNTGIGYRALNGEGGPLTGTHNTGLGAFVGRNMSTGQYNALIGSGCGLNLKSGNNSTAVGFEALYNATGVSDLTAFGYRALRGNTTGIRNTGIGFSALAANQAGSDNTALGWGSLPSATGSGNTGLGSRTQEATTTGVNNTTNGFEAGRNITTGSANTFIGTRSGREAGATNDNVAIGSDALQFLTTGSSNTAVGRSALRIMQDGNDAVTLTNATGVGAGSMVSGSNQLQLGSSGVTTYAYGAVQYRSDERDKADVRDTVLGLSFIEDLRAVDFRWDMRDDYVVTHEDGSVEVLPKDGSKKRNRYHHGLIAQQVREVMERHGVDFGGFQDHSINCGCDVLSIGYTELIAPLIKAVQELSAKVEELESKMTA